MNTKLTVLLVLLLLGPELQISRGQTPAPATVKPEELANEWFVRLNELDDWYISYDGKEENDAVVSRFMDLYAADALHQVGPMENQIGSVVFSGISSISSAPNTCFCRFNISCIIWFAWPSLSIFQTPSSRTKGTVSHEPNEFFTCSVALSPSIFSARYSTDL